MIEMKYNISYSFAYEYAKIWINLLSCHTFSALKILYVWFQNKIGYYIFREISPKLTINIYIYRSTERSSSDLSEYIIFKFFTNIYS